MGGGLIQLIAYGFDDMYLTYEPQITFFKVVYRRHTNFSTEQIPQYFINTPNFGKISTCIISRNADLVGNINLVITLPKVRFADSNSKLLFAWVKRIGFSLIKKIELEINGNVIDTHYGEWLSIWSELTGEINGEHSKSINTMIGNVPNMTNFTNSKDEYLLYIPLQFWFCRGAGLTLPIVALQNSDVKINVEFEDPDKCYMLGPSHYIQCNDSIVNFIPFEYIEQNINGTINAGIFINFDIPTKRLYYYKVSAGKLLSTVDDIPYPIIGKTSQYITYGNIKSTSLTYPSPPIRNLNFVQCFLLVDYYFLDDDERMRFAQSKHDYLIEQLYYTPNINLNSGSANTQIIVEHPCKLMAWVTQMNYIQNAKDYYNYTNSYQHKILEDTSYPNVNVGDPINKSLITSETILLNGNERLSLRNSLYFDKIQKYQYTRFETLTGINMYSFAAFPFMTQPSGSFNASQIDNIQIQLKLSSIISPTNQATFRCYCLCLNVLRIVNGLAALVFTR